VMKIRPYTIEEMVIDFNVFESILLFRCSLVWIVTTHRSARLRCQQHEIQTFYCLLCGNLSLHIQSFLIMAFKNRNMLQYKCSIIYNKIFKHIF